MLLMHMRLILFHYNLWYMQMFQNFFYSDCEPNVLSTCYLTKEKKIQSGTYLAQFFAFMMRQQRSQALKACIDALHASPFIAIRNFTSHALLVFHCVRSSATVFFSIQTVNANKRKFKLVYECCNIGKIRIMTQIIL